MLRTLTCTLAIALCLLAATETAHAQKVLEVRGGLTAADVSGYAYDTQFEPGFMLGLSYRNLANLGPLSLQPGLDFVQRGFKEGDYSLRINYLDLSLMLRYSLDAGFVNPFVKAGPYLGYALGATEHLGDLKSDQEVNDFDYGGIIEGGFQINSLILGARASAGLGDIRNSSTGNPNNYYFAAYVGLAL